MPIRAIVLFNIGSPFGGLRLALAPGFLGIDHPEAFEALEGAIDDTYKVLGATRPDAWPELASSGYGPVPPRLGKREGFVDVAVGADDGGPGDEVLARACLPFRLWPLGGWVAYDGRRRSAHGTWTPFSDEELAELW